MACDIIHVSDLHIRHPRTVSKLHRLALILKNRFKGFDSATLSSAQSLDTAVRNGQGALRERDSLCVVTGDLTADGGRSQLDWAKRYLRNTMEWSSSVRVGLQDEWAPWVFGNHDVWGGGLFRGTVRGLATSEEMRSDISLGGADRAHLVLALGQAVRDFGTTRLRVYTLDSVAYGWTNLLANGRIRLGDLQDLEVKIRDDEEFDKSDKNIRRVVRCLLMHHPCFPLDPGRRTLNLKNAPWVADRLRGLRIGIVLSGHEHIPDVRGNDPVQVVAGSACTGAERTLVRLRLKEDITSGPVRGDVEIWSDSGLGFRLSGLHNVRVPSIEVSGESLTL
jgi:3',5'-cyclic AMP phosphodiesterase CpdA